MKQDTAVMDGLGVRWAVGPGIEVTVEETGPDLSAPPVLVLAGAPFVLMLVPPQDREAWPDCVVFLRRLRDHAEDLAALLEARAERRDREEG
ncbi:hypothetical protein OG439_14295 [Amycolatopsis sp. NBC_01307]|uniref:hypothetical protein n=1 Tax=Amycolatopsis sp. NBC_01307 TaxID=2903561 RepID=UPI002E14352B|nr:hypothetical protein OG439_14295 [Amycolatopsis sp. NBC_01307]